MVGEEAKVLLYLQVQPIGEGGHAVLHGRVRLRTDARAHGLAVLGDDLRLGRAHEA